MAQVAIAIPLMRPHRLSAVLDSLAESTSDYHVVVIAAGECADATRTLPVTLIEDEGGTWAQRINRAFRETTEPVLFTAADDLQFHTGWFEAAMQMMETVHGVVAVNDLHNGAGVHFLVEREYINTIGGVMDEPAGVVCHEGYVHSYVDDEIRATAIARNRWGYCRESVVEHMHAGAGKAPHDDVYDMGAASMPQGLALFQSRSHLWS